MVKRRASVGFNLAFLDIMACGLGAIVLVFMLVKKNIDNSSTEVTLLNADLQRLEQKTSDVKSEIEVTKDLSSSEREKIKQIEAEIIKIQKAIKANSSDIAEKKARISSLKNKILATPKEKKSDVVNETSLGEEEYVMGLRVEGKRIAVLVDSSASMTDEKLIDIIKRKSSSDNNKKLGPKWIRTKKTVRWLMARAPIGSQLSVVSFNDKVKSLGGSDWINGRDKIAISRVFAELDSVIPSGSTNLQKGFKKLSELNATDLYLITDGLPTSGDSNYRSLNPFSSCGSLWGSGKTISGECRVRLFRKTINDNYPKVSGKINILLLPLEGDQDASPELWMLASSSGGLLISPAENWP